MSFVERSIILYMCPYLGGSTIGGSTIIDVHDHFCLE